MTKNEALNKAINIVRYFEANFAKSKEARDEAVNIIKALEQEPCEDCISREDAMSIILCYGNDIKAEVMDDIKASMIKLPPVTPQHTDAEIQKIQELEQAEIQKAYELGKEDKIRAEIEKTDNWSIKDVADTLEKHGLIAEQEPCEDAISRQAVDTLVDELARAISDERCCVSRGRSTATIMQDILDLPSVIPKGVTITDFADKCRECGREKVLDKIRAEVLNLDDINPDYPMDRTIHISRNEVLEIIDKYKESEDKE